jgi:hypothetical protein
MSSVADGRAGLVVADRVGDHQSPEVSSASIARQGTRLPVLDGIRGLAIVLVMC